MFDLSRMRLYQSISTIDPDINDDDQSGSEKPSLNSKTEWPRSFKYIGVCIIVMFATILAFTFGRSIGYQQSNKLREYDVIESEASGYNCTTPYYRREWRSLSRQEKMSYVAAVNCLALTPSVLRDNGTVYDDFPWVHFQMSHMTHGKPAFLTWHRRFTFVYEKYLQNICDYRGALPYWDWTLDWEDPPSSPIFSPTTGFGGDGDLNAPESVGKGHCVTKGPFANLKPLFYGPYDRPHCFSRGFTANFSTAYALSPMVIESIMNSTDYEGFFLAMVNGPHNTIPNGVRGDFWSFTAPYDPIHFLHHAQIDRLWYHWQNKDSKIRLNQYSGKTEGKTGATVSLDDVLPMGGLDEDITVLQIMNTESFEMCYRYA